MDMAVTPAANSKKQATVLPAGSVIHCKADKVNTSKQSEGATPPEEPQHGEETSPTNLPAQQIEACQKIVQALDPRSRYLHRLQSSFYQDDFSKHLDADRDAVSERDANHELRAGLHTLQFGRVRK